MTKPLLIIGAGGHGAVILDAALAAGFTVLGLTDADPALHGTRVLDRPVLGGDDVVLSHNPDAVQLTVGIGSTGNTDLHREIHDRFAARNYRFATVIHPTATVAGSAAIADGTVLMAGAIVQPRCRIGKNVILNTGAQIDHDCDIGPHCHIAPGAVLSGNVTVGAGSHVGTGAVVIQGITIGREAICAAGAVVIRNVPDTIHVAGNPASEIAH